MSDLENDLDDEILALAGAGDKKRKRRQGPSSSSKTSSSKKRKAEITDSEDDGPESEDEDFDPYPLEGKYVDEADRLRLMQMSEIDREETITLRLDEKQRLHDKRTILRMVKDQQGGDSDNVAKAAKRQHIARGATKEKSRKLDELKAKRKAKDEKQRNQGSPRRNRSSSPMDMDISDGESEDGQITKDEQEEERERKLLGNHSKSPLVEAQIVMEDLEKCRLSRDMLAKYCMAPWFQDYVQDAWVRYLIGHEKEGDPVYRICEIANLGADLVKAYKIDDKMANQTLELKHGQSIRSFLMDKVSNGPFQQKEFDRLIKVCSLEDVKLPSKRRLESKSTQMTKLLTQPVTESDINAMLARKSQLQNNKPPGLTTMERSRLNQARTLAQRRQDYVEVAEIDTKLRELEASKVGRSIPRDDHVDMLAKVNERNRKANLEAVRKAEFADAERKRRERKLGGGIVTPQPYDPSARLKTKPRLFNAATPTTRPGTPNLNGAPSLQPSNIATSRPESPLPSSLSASLKANTFEAAFIDSIEIDLGDF